MYNFKERGHVEGP